jgi:hypothetical protein
MKAPFDFQPDVDAMPDEGAYPAAKSRGVEWRDIDYLQGSGFEIAKGEPDIRGWAIWSREGRKLGVVTDLLINTRHKLAEFLDVELDEGHEVRHVIVPIKTSLLNDAKDEVHFLGTSSDVVARPAELAQSPNELQLYMSRFFGTRRDGRDPSMYLSGPSLS